MTIQISGLHTYPLKSARGISLSGAHVEKTGLAYDRLWLVTNSRGMFVAQRSDAGLGIGVRIMCLIEPAIQGSNLVLSAPEMPDLVLPLDGHEGKKVQVQVWETFTEATNQGLEADKWITKYLSQERPDEYHLVRMSTQGIRKTKRGTGQVAFADAYPFLILSQESLDDLNARLSTPLPISRFRPNIVLSGCNAYDEDNMGLIRIAGITFEGVKLCVRCPITTFDENTMQRGKEPLRTLAEYRKTDKGVVFGKNFNNLNVGNIAVGDEVEVLRWEDSLL